MMTGDHGFAEVQKEATWMVEGNEEKGYSTKKAEKAFQMDWKQALERSEKFISPSQMGSGLAKIQGQNGMEWDSWNL